MLARYNPQALFFRQTLLRGNRIRGYVHLEYRILQIWVAEIVMRDGLRSLLRRVAVYLCASATRDSEAWGQSPRADQKPVLRQPICTVALTPRSASSDKIAGQPPQRLWVSSQDGVQVAGSAHDRYHQLLERVLEHLLHHPETRCNLTKLAFFDLLDGQEVAFVALVKPIEETDLAARRPNRKANDPFGQSNPTASRRALGFPGVTPVPSRWDQPLAQSGQRLSDFSNRTVNDWLRGA